MKKSVMVLSLLFSGFAGSAHALSFEWAFTANTTALQQASFVAAGQLWSNLLTDNVTIKLTAGTSTSLASNVLGQAASRELFYDYTDVRSALVADNSSTIDQTAVSHLSTGNSFGMLLNRTANNPNGAGSAATYVDNDGDLNNTIISMTAGNARALGLSVSSGQLSYCSTECDSFIQFNANFNWDYDRSNGIGSSQFDFVGIAAHEIGHALGFISGVDTLDFASQSTNGGPERDNLLPYVSTLDLFRWSASSKASGVIDWTADTRAKYFSVDGGTTALGTFSTGITFGDGRQASHWKDNLALGIMDPTSANGELLSISNLDITAFDAIGWDVQTLAAPVPEPAESLLVLAGLAVLGCQYRRAIPARRI